MCIPSQMVYTNKAPLAVSPTGSAERLAKTRHYIVMLKVMGSLFVGSIQQNTLVIDEHKIHNTVSIDRGMLEPCNNFVTNASQRLLVEEELRRKML